MDVEEGVGVLLQLGLVEGLHHGVALGELHGGIPVGGVEALGTLMLALPQGAGLTGAAHAAAPARS